MAVEGGERRDGAEQRHATDEVDVAIDEAGGQLVTQVGETIVGVVDHSQAIE